MTAVYVHRDGRTVAVIAFSCPRCGVHAVEAASRLPDPGQQPIDWPALYPHPHLPLVEIELLDGLPRPVYTIQRPPPPP